jgi:hypothetical protein
MTEHPLLSFFEDETVAEYAAEADADSDPVSITYLVVGDEPTDQVNDGDIMMGALVFLKSAEVVAAFKTWAATNGFLTIGKDIRDRPQD